MCIFHNVLFTWKRKRTAESVRARNTGCGSEANNNVIVLLSMLFNDSHLPLVPRLRMSGATPLLPMYAFVTCTATTLLPSFFILLTVDITECR